MDIVLYESVRPTGSRQPSGETEEERVHSTQQSLEFIADVAVRGAETSNMLPKSFDDVIVEASLLDSRLAAWVEDASVDAWGRQFIFRIEFSTNTLTFESYGADGKVGGTGESTDLIATKIVMIVPNDEFALGASDPQNNIQEDLAVVLGLAFQLEALPYENPNWVCSDMTMDEVEAKLIERGADTSLLSVLTGESFAVKIASSIMKLVPLIDTFIGGGIRESVRLLMIEMLSLPDSDQLLAGIEPELAQVIIVDRNTELLEDLAATLETTEDVSSIGVLYGAGHMFDLAPRLNSLFGYSPIEERWFVSMSVNPNDSFLKESDLKRMRFMLQYQMRKKNGS
jgi:hypothetical protein